jgi:ubiquinone/menaquinone biosynthesis C-methylase UbiE
MNERTFRASEAHKLEDPERRVWLPVVDIVTALGVKQGMNIADVGAGTGYFTLPFAAEVGISGKVFAVDLQREMLDLLRKKVQAGNSSVIELVQGDAAATTLPSQSVDLVFMANIWHELDDHVSILREAKRTMRVGSRIAILDWRADLQPPPGPPAWHRISAQSVAATLERGAWKVTQSRNIGSYSHLIIANPLP